MGSGIEFESETSTTENTTVGYFDYIWVDNTDGNQWGQADITVKKAGVATKRAHAFAPGFIGSFLGDYVPATNQQVGDFNGSFPEYRMYASGSTTDATVTSLKFALPNTPTSLRIPNDTTWMFTVYVVGRRTDADNDSVAMWIRNAAHNNADTVTLLDATGNTLKVGNTDLNATVTAVANSIAIRVTGQLTKTIYWNAVINIIQVSG